LGKLWVTAFFETPRLSSELSVDAADVGLGALAFSDITGTSIEGCAVSAAEAAASIDGSMTE
jgi:hypothetical protein